MKKMMGSPSRKVKFLLRVEDDILSTLRELAQAKSVSLSQLLRDILGDYVEKLAETPPLKARLKQPLSQIVTKKDKQWWE